MFTIELNDDNFNSLIQDTELEKGDVIIIGKIHFMGFSLFINALNEKYEWSVLARWKANWEGRCKGSITKISILSKKEVVIQETMSEIL